ncbi:MAG TPA: hypothetical protein VGK74_02620 [Symbiobacteriaceae bacterium]
MSIDLAKALGVEWNEERRKRQAKRLPGVRAHLAPRCAVWQTAYSDEELMLALEMAETTPLDFDGALAYIRDLQQMRDAAAGFEIALKVDGLRFECQSAGAPRWMILDAVTSGDAIAELEALKERALRGDTFKLEKETFRGTACELSEAVMELGAEITKAAHENRVLDWLLKLIDR